MGIALPQWIVESKNNIWVLGVYGLLFGGALPALVVCDTPRFPLTYLLIIVQGRWWFGSRQKTKDGVHAQSAASLFKSLNEESSLDQVIGMLGKAYQWEVRARKSEPEIGQLERAIQGKIGFRWDDVSRLCDSDSRRKALVLIYAHLLRLPIHNPSLQKGVSCY
jgi:translocation protein SEC63